MGHASLRPMTVDPLDLDQTLQGSREAEMPHIRATLAERLSNADEESFVEMLWALNALQTGRSQFALPFFRGLPVGALTEGILGPNAVYPWELETLGNELLASPRNNVFRFFNCRSWGAMTETVNILRNLEGAEYSARRHELNILREMGRIGARQFEWQRGFATTAAFYRSALIYGQGECARYFNDTHDISVADMSFVGFALMAAFHRHPVIRPRSDLHILHEMGVAPDKLRTALRRLARPFAEIASEASELRRDGAATAYKPSILRQYPCILMGSRRQRMRSPLPDLIVSRVTSGLFYDVVSGGGSVRDDYGRRFETYAHQLLTRNLAELLSEREWGYRVAGTLFHTPDIIVSNLKNEVTLVIECKAARMSIAARFGEDPSEERGYEEMAKGVAQIWRFYSHCRRKYSGRDALSGSKGLILALDDWFIARGPMIELVLKRAHSLADRMDPDIIIEDRRPVAFASIAELENVMETATIESFQATIDLASTADRLGWMFSSLHQELDVPKAQHRPYQFQEDIARLLPWWSLRGQG